MQALGFGPVPLVMQVAARYQAQMDRLANLASIHGFSPDLAREALKLGVTSSMSLDT